MQLKLTTYLSNITTRRESSYFVLPNGERYYITSTGNKLTDEEMDNKFPIQVTKVKTDVQLFKGDAMGQNGLQ